MSALVTFGNSKLPKSTMIFNMSSAMNCSSRLLGMCLVCGFCYARKAEKLYPPCLPYRTRQEGFWLSSTAEEIIEYFDSIIKSKRKKPTLFRYNEAGDFHSQACVEKLDIIAKYLKKTYGIVTYGYSARKDLNFSGVSFLVKSSGHNNGNKGQTRVIAKNMPKPENFKVCPGDCKACSMCSSDKGINIVFIKH